MDFPMDFWLFLNGFINVLFNVITNLIPSKRVMSSPFLHKTIFFSESCFGDLMLYVAKKFD
jgi:hypothetical protein